MGSSIEEQPVQLRSWGKQSQSSCSRRFIKMSLGADTGGALGLSCVGPGL